MLGRARASENVDIIIPKTSLNQLKALYTELKNGKFYCLNCEKIEDIYNDYLNNNIAVRFARISTAIPNIELKFVKNEIDLLTLKNKIVVRVSKEDIFISQLELQIAFKEEVLQSPKDMEDARHLRNIAENCLDKKLIEEYKVMLHGI